MRKVKLNHIERENELRHKTYFGEYDPYTGRGSHIERELLEYSINGTEYHVFLPIQMFELPLIQEFKKEPCFENVLKKFNPNYTSLDLQNFYAGFNKTRIEYDFEFWATSFIITDKKSGAEVPFILNYPQRAILLPEIEKQRFAGTKIRVNVCKARQWGGSTLIDAYIFYIQNVLKPEVKWSSAILTLIEEQARTIRGMYRLAASRYPNELGSISFQSHEQSSKNLQIKETGSVLYIGSTESPDSIRSADLKAAHFSEVGLWKKTAGKTPEDLVQTIHGTLSGEPLSFAAYESTAKGVGNFFHTLWQNSVKGDGFSSYKPVFVPWYVIYLYLEDYSKKYNLKQFIESWDEYEEWLWDMGATLEGIYWYRNKLNGEMEGDTWRMRSEFPTTADEAFQSTGRPVFHPSWLQSMDLHLSVPYKQGRMEAKSNKGAEALEKLAFYKIDNGHLKVWSDPVPYAKDPIKNRYVVSLDIGGSHRDADKSIVTVLDRIWLLDGDGELEVVASAEFNLDQDLTVWVAIQIARWYNNALFIPESNSLDSEADTEGNHFLTILDEIVDHYENIYTRTNPEDVKNGVPTKYGFHTNKQTKPLIIDNFKALLREAKFIEREPNAVAEMKSFEHKENGKTGGAGSMHDDYPMSRMIASWCATKYMEMPKRVHNDPEQAIKRRRTHNITGEASI